MPQPKPLAPPATDEGPLDSEGLSLVHLEDALLTTDTSSVLVHSRIRELSLKLSPDVKSATDTCHIPLESKTRKLISGVSQESLPATDNSSVSVGSKTTKDVESPGAEKDATSSADDSSALWDAKIRAYTVRRQNRCNTAPPEFLKRDRSSSPVLAVPSQVIRPIRASSGSAEFPRRSVVGVHTDMLRELIEVRTICKELQRDSRLVRAGQDRVEMLIKQQRAAPDPFKVCQKVNFDVDEVRDVHDCKVSATPACETGVLAEEGDEGEHERTFRCRPDRAGLNHMDSALTVQMLPPAEDSPLPPIPQTRWKKSSGFRPTPVTASQMAVLAREMKHIKRNRSSVLGFIVGHWFFNLFWTTLIILSGIVTGLEADFKAGHGHGHRFFDLMNWTFCGLFIVELLLRIAAHRSQFFRGKDYVSNYFEVAIVLGSVAEVALQLSDSPSQSRLLKIMRLLRLVRIVRVVHFSKKLKLMAVMILESMKSLLAVFALIVLVIYVFSITFTLAVTDYVYDLSHVPAAGDAALIKLHYGSVVRSSYTCFKAFLGGVSWGEVLDPLVDVGLFYVVVFVFYILFTMLALLNVITSVFVDGALAKSATERDLVAEREMHIWRETLANLKDIFMECDEDNSGTLTYDEFLTILDKEETMAYLQTLNIDAESSTKIFTDLDKNQDGTIDMFEFIENMQFLISESKSGLQQRRLLESLCEKIDRMNCNLRCSVAWGSHPRASRKQ